MWAAWQLSVLAMGLMCSDHLQPGWNVARPTAPASRFTSSSCPLPPSNGLVSSGELRLFRTRPAMMNPPGSGTVDQDPLQRIYPLLSSCTHILVSPTGITHLNSREQGASPYHEGRLVGIAPVSPRP